MRLPFIPWSIAGVPSSIALLGLLITAPPCVCVPAVIGTLAGFKTQKIPRTLMYIDLRHIVLQARVL